MEFDIPANALDINDGEQGMEGAMAADVGTGAYHLDTYHNENMPTEGSGMAVDDNRVPQVPVGKMPAEEEGGFAAQEAMAE